MVEKTGKGCGCGCGSILLGLLLVCALAMGIVSTQALMLGDEPLSSPKAASSSGLTWNELLADREQAKKESRGWNGGCEIAQTVGLFFGAPAYIIYPIAGNDPAGREGFWGSKIDSRDWTEGFVPMNTSLPEGIFRTYQAFYWNALVTGATSTHGLGGGCKLRPIKKSSTSKEG
jgi:hypothetical protein